MFFDLCCFTALNADEDDDAVTATAAAAVFDASASINEDEVGAAAPVPAPADACAGGELRFRLAAADGGADDGGVCVCGGAYGNGSTIQKQQIRIIQLKH